jgi:transcriptional regulator with XRE-family HTH domain/tetratricopeptide (TPR) repeat protein
MVASAGLPEVGAMRCENGEQPGWWLRQLRAEVGLTQEQLAERAGLSVRAISNLERGRTRKPFPHSLRALAAALGLPETAPEQLITQYRVGQNGHPSGEAPGAVPRQLPAAAAHFVGRGGELGVLDSLLDRVAGRAGTVVISAICGTAGVGKTTLALHWAHRSAESFPDGQLYVNLRGFDPADSPVTPAKAIRGFLDALRVPAEQMLGGLDAQAALYRSLLAGKRMLIMLDNARSVGQVRPLLPGAGGCLVLVTSRRQLTGLIAAEAAVPVALDVLDAAEAWEMLRSRLGADRVAREPYAVARLIEVCARLPLALSVAAARAVQRPGSSLAALAIELEDARGRLDQLDAGDGVTSVRAAISWSYRQLGDQAARVFRLLGVHPGPDISAPATASLAGLSRPQARRALAELTGAHLIVEHAVGRFAFHDLLRAYAAELAADHESEPERRAATHRMLDHYLHSANAASRELYPARGPIPLADAQPGSEPENMADGRAALAWLNAEYHVILAVIARAVDASFDAYAQRLPEVLATFLDRQGRWQDCVSVQQVSLAAAQRRQDRSGQARAHRFMGRAYIRLGCHRDGYGHLTKAMRLFCELGDHLGQARSHLAVSMALEDQGRSAEALRHAEQALPLFRLAGHRAGEAAALNMLSYCHSALGAYQQALTHGGQGLVLQRELGNPDGEAESWSCLGEAHQALGCSADAIACYRHALILLAELGQTYNRAIVLDDLGDAYRSAGNRRAACRAWAQAVTILNDLRHPGAARVQAKLSAFRCPATVLTAVSGQESSCRGS